MKEQINPSLQPLGALSPETILVDERTLRERLGFAARYGELILFFDRHNKANGTWQNFYLKDPMILLALISTTPYKPIHRIAVPLFRALEEADVNWNYEWLREQKPHKHDATDYPSPKQQDQLNELFYLNNRLFEEINDWLDHMSVGHKEYTLRTFVETQVQHQLGASLGQQLSLQALAHAVCPAISAPHSHALKRYNVLWQGAAQQQTLTLIPEDDGDKIIIDVNILQKCREIYYEVFGFFVQVINSAKETFHQMWEDPIERGDRYPDTALLTAFAELMSYQQAELNELSQKHLHFYYRDILLQKEQPARPDRTVVCLTLKPDVDPLLLPQGSLFDGGVNTAQEPQLFASTQSQWLNHTTIDGLFTLWHDKSGTLKSNTLKDTDKVRKNPEGKTQSQPLFADTNQGTKTIQQGWAIGSPMLLLTGGSRRITLTLQWSDTAPPFQWDSAQFFVSTASEWKPIKLATARPHTQSEAQQATSTTLTFSLDPSFPPIVPFTKPPAGYSAQWPLLRCLMDATNQAEPPTLTQCDLEVFVENLQELTLYSDLGPLDPNQPYPPFGTLPDVGSNFYMGSTEIVSKPLELMVISLGWKHYPKDGLEDYYEAYNRYLNTLNPIGPQGSQGSPSSNHLMPIEVITFYDGAFLATFSLFETQGWQPLGAYSIALPQTSSEEASSEEASSEEEQTLPANTSLFSSILPDKATLKKVPEGLFKSNQSKAMLYLFPDTELKKLTPDPTLQLSPLQFEQPMKRGFMRWQLEEPKYGFGFTLYPQVIAAVTMENAQILIDTTKSDTSQVPPSEPASSKDKKQSKDDPPPAKEDETNFLPLPNPPYVPQVASLSFTYLALQTTTLLATNEGVEAQEAPIYPFALYFDDGFSTSMLFSTETQTQNQSTSLIAPTPKKPASSGQALFPSKLTGGFVYLMLDHVQPPSNLSLYFHIDDLATHYQETQEAQDDEEKVTWYYQTASLTWKTLTPLSDGTKALRCSGIVQLSLPDDLGEDSPLGPQDPPKAPGQRAWLLLYVPSDIAKKTRVSYLNTQAVEVERQFQIPWTDAQAPSLAAESIKGTTPPLPSIDKVVQPFASVGGRGKEGHGQMLRRVSERLETKDRAVGLHELVKLAYRGLPSLYYSKVLGQKNPQQDVTLVLVKQTQLDPTTQEPEAGALRPVVDFSELETLYQYLKQRISPFTTLMLTNPSYEAVEVRAVLLFAPNVAAGQLCQQMEQELIVYLSPWITNTTIPQRQIDTALTKDELSDFFLRWEEVVEVVSLEVTLIDAATPLDPPHHSGEKLHKVPTFPVVPSRRDGLFISSPTHSISQAQS